MADIFTEVDEDLRREQWKKLWQRFGNVIAAASLAVLLVTLGVVYWRHYATDRAQRITSELLQAHGLLETRQYKEASVALAALRSKAGGDLAALAGLLQAQALAGAGEQEQAAGAAQAVYAQHDASASWRDLGALNAATLRGSNAVEVNDASPFAYSARAWRIWHQLNRGEKEEAAAGMKALRDDAAAPAPIRARMSEALAYLAPEPEKASTPPPPDKTP